MLQLQTTAGKVNIDDNEIEQFYHQVDTMLKSTMKHEIAILMGDMNARVVAGIRR